MFCDQCGTRMNDQAKFCPNCGKGAARVIPMMPVQGRIGGHIRLLGILWLAISAFRLLPGVFLMSMARHGGMTFLPPDVPMFVHAILRVAGMALLATGVVGIITGWGLLERQPWARMLAIVLGCLNLVDMPFGTGLGIYTLWVLLPAKSEEEYRQIARAA
jgi:hypothetical protein